MSVERLLDRLVPASEQDGNWERVLADARGRSRQVRALHLGLPLLAAGVIGVAALAWPFENEPPTVLARALAAIGDGPVIHIVSRGDHGSDLVNLTSGEVAPLLAESEVWYDPKRGVHRISRLGGRVTSDSLTPPGMVSAREAEHYVSLVNRYRSQLRSGKARVVARGEVNGRAVLWIRLNGQWRADGDDAHYHLWAEEVAVDRTTYEPVYARTTRDGRPTPAMSGGELFLKLETLSAGEGDFDADPGVSRRTSIYAGSELARELSRGALRRFFGEPAIWLGEAHEGKRLAEAREQLFKHKENRDDPWQTVRGVSLFYGELRPRRFGIRFRDDRKPFVLLTEAKEISPMWSAAQDGVDVPEGAVRIDAGGTGFLREGRIYVSINAHTVRDVLAAAVELRPVGAPAPPRSTLDLARIAREVESRKAHTAVASGGSRVRARPIVRRGSKAVQSGSGDGVTVRIYGSGAAVFDTTRMSASRRAMVHGEITAGCAKITGPTGSLGGFSTPFRRRITILLLGHFVRGQRPRPISPPFDVCELGLGQGRNALQRFNWHGPVEIPLTERGRRFVEERAAAREVSTFARVGAMRRARAAMRQGAPAPPAASLADPRGRVGVVSGGNRITVSLTATTGRRFFVEIVRGKIGSTNARRFARVS
jgi:hypothetical protein